MSAADIGHKFARLETLRRAGLPVPQLHCLPADRFRQAAARLRHHLDRELATVDFERPETVHTAAAHIKALFAVAPVDDLDLDRVFAAEERVAVRACVIGAEDADDDPYAGLSDSFLFVPRDEVADRVRDCWASAFNAESILYRHTRGLPIADVAVAVGIQRMAPGVRSFVLFTRDPRSGDRRTVIAAGHGIGEGVVQEKVAVDHFFYDGVVHARMVDKPEMLAPDPAGGLRMLPVPPHLRDRPVLDDDEVRRLAEVGRRVEELFGAPQDIEGTFTADGRLHLVQARPIALDFGLHREWSNANVTESFPGVTTALTYSFARTFYRSIFHDLYRRLGVPSRTLCHDVPYLDRMIGLHHGRVYYQLDAWYHLHRRLTVFPLFQRSWESMMGLQPRRAEHRAPALRMLRPLTRVARHLIVHDRSMRRFEAAWEAVIAPRRGRDRSTSEPLALIAELHEVERAAGDLWGLTLINDSVLSSWNGMVQRLLRRWVPDGDVALLPDLLCGDEENHSVTIVRSTVRLAELLRQHPDVLAAIEADPAGAWERLGVDLRAAFDGHLHRYGDRSLQELKMEQPSLRSTPGQLLTLAARYARSELTVDGLRRTEQGIRAGAEQRLARALGPRSVRLRLLRALLGRLRRSVCYRENSRYCRSEWFGLAKDVFARLGEDLARRGVLRDATDAVHLTRDELIGWFDGSGVSSALQPLADARRAELEQPGPELSMRFTTLGTVPASRPVGESPAEDGGGLRGLGSSSGVVRGAARVVLDPRQPMPPGGILIARQTDPGWLFLMLNAEGIVVERGTMLSHTAITGRKFGIPTIVAVPGATTRIPDGALIEMDGATGRVTILEAP